MYARLAAVFADTPLLFFAVVIGVALAFRVGVGLARAEADPSAAALPTPAAPKVIR